MRYKFVHFIAQIHPKRSFIGKFKQALNKTHIFFVCLHPKTNVRLTKKWKDYSSEKA